MNLALSLSLTGARRAGGDPYAAFTAAYDFGNADGTTLSGSEITTAHNLGAGGASYDFAQGTSANRPLLTSGQAVFDDSNDYMENAACAAIIQTGEYVLNITFTIDSLATDGTLIACSQATTNARYHMQILTNGRLRITERDTANVTVANSGDLFVDGASVVMVTGQQYTISIQETGGLMNVWFDGVLAYEDIAFNTGTQDATFTRANIGALRISTSSSSLFGGKIRAFDLTAL